MEGYSGYTKLQKQLQEEYGFDGEIPLNEIEKKAWIVGQFIAKDEQKLEEIENVLRLNAQGGSDEELITRTLENSDFTTAAYDSLLKRFQMVFFLDATDNLEGISFDTDIDKFVINNVLTCQKHLKYKRHVKLEKEVA